MSRATTSLGPARTTGKLIFRNRGSDEKGIVDHATILAVRRRVHSVHKVHEMYIQQLPRALIASDNDEIRNENVVG